MHPSSRRHGDRSLLVVGLRLRARRRQLDRPPPRHLKNLPPGGARRDPALPNLPLEAQVQFPLLVLDATLANLSLARSSAYISVAPAMASVRIYMMASHQYTGGLDRKVHMLGALAGLKAIILVVMKLPRIQQLQVAVAMQLQPVSLCNHNPVHRLRCASLVRKQMELRLLVGRRM